MQRWSRILCYRKCPSLPSLVACYTCNSREKMTSLSAYNKPRYNYEEALRRGKVSVAPVIMQRGREYKNPNNVMGEGVRVQESLRESHDPSRKLFFRCTGCKGREEGTVRACVRAYFVLTSRIRAAGIRCLNGIIRRGKCAFLSPPPPFPQAGSRSRSHTTAIYAWSFLFFIWPCLRGVVCRPPLPCKEEDRAGRRSLPNAFGVVAAARPWGWP